MCRVGDLPHRTDWQSYHLKRRTGGTFYTVLFVKIHRREGLKTLIKSQLRQIMKTVDLDDITSKRLVVCIVSCAVC